MHAKSHRAAKLICVSFRETRTGKGLQYGNGL